MKKENERLCQDISDIILTLIFRKKKSKRRKRLVGSFLRSEKREPPQGGKGGKNMFSEVYKTIIENTASPLSIDLINLRDKIIEDLYESHESEIQELDNRNVVYIAQVLALRFLLQDFEHFLSHQNSRILQRLSQSDKFLDDYTQDKIHQLFLEWGSRRGSYLDTIEIESSAQIHDESNGLSSYQ